MPSSTSNFKRPGPDLPWPRIWALAGAVVLLTLGGAELFWRTRGYPAELRDGPGLWALMRKSVAKNDPRQVVIIGDSRMQNGISTAAFQEVFKTKPVQLALVNGAAVPVLFNLAQDPSFNSIVVSSVNRWDLSGMPEKWERPNGYINYYKGLTPTQIVDERVSMLLEQSLIFMLPDLAPAQLAAAAWERKWPDKPFVHLNPDRSRVTDYSKCPHLELRKKRMEGEGWFKEFSPVDQPQMLRDLAKIQSAVARIQERGGHVVFVRMPSSGPVRELEDKMFPREKFWRLWVERTGALAISFEDYPELSGFDCPDYVHLDQKDAGTFSRALAEIIRRKIDEESPQR